MKPNSSFSFFVVSSVLQYGNKHKKMTFYLYGLPGPAVRELVAVPRCWQLALLFVLFFLLDLMLLQCHQGSGGSRWKCCGN